MEILVEKKVSFEDYLKYDNEDNKYELFEGELNLMTPPTGFHALIINRLTKLIEEEINRLNLDWYGLQGIGIRTGIRRSRLPDLTIINQPQLKEILKISAVLETPPLLVIEIVSPESEIRDYRYKRSEYSAMGIPEYWIVDPNRETMTILQLQEGMYEQISVLDTGQISSRVFPEIQIKPENLFNL
ncbi:Uma2 family endonuclease [Geminocystis herdmanii]|uniref:Uma2 family endonuclease n=1 Tax=Geminocystis herdmanii TaxID=669359 RepID=UPI00034A64CE|nr:Uma2 family endonuclease [Geminocystis herdmanii]